MAKFVPDDAIDRAIWEKSLHKFIIAAWPTLEPETPFMDSWHVGCLAEHLQAVADGQIKRLAINVCPGLGKSRYCGVFFPVWTWLTYPHFKFLCVSYSENFALRDTKLSRDLIRGAWFQKNWGQRIRIRRDQDTAGFYGNVFGGTRTATSVTGSGTGARAHVSICLPHGAMVTTDRGPLMIGEIVEGMADVSVAGFDHATGEIVWQNIDEYEINPPGEMVEIVLADGKKLLCTEDHPVYIVGKGYVRADSVQDGDEVLIYAE